MTETLTPQNTQSEFDKQTDEALALANGGVHEAQLPLISDEEFSNNISSAAQRSVEVPIQEEQDAAQEVPVNHGKTNTAKRVIAGVAGVALAGGAVAAVAETFKPAEFEGKTTYIVEDGDGLQNAAEQIAGIETVDMRDGIDSIQGDPANIDVLKDGLQPGEILQIPLEVKGYEEQK